MLYNSFQFLFVFLPVCLLVYILAVRISGGLANALLVVMSLIFYGWGHWENLALIVGSIVFNYMLGHWIARVRAVAGSTRAREVLVFGITVNMVMLAYFKYVNFIALNIASLLGKSVHPMAVVLPLGISFFTFTQIAFLVDAYQGKTRELDFVRYCLFVSFFPHLIAGPIVHHADLMPQFANPANRQWIPRNVHVGLAFLTLGLCKKVILADTCAPWADRVFDAAGNVGCLDAWRGTLAYTLQIYFDFSGYSDMAIGLALLFNIRLPDNFDSPYKSTNIVDFWRRWHMTLSRFLRDYLYIPLGGNRLGEPRKRFNLMVTMLLGGMWHGADWTFLIWGGYHGFLLLVNHTWEKTKITLPHFLARAITLLAVMFGWVFFRAPGVHRAVERLVNLFHVGIPSSPYMFPTDKERLIRQSAALVAMFLLALFAPNTKQWIESRPLTRRRAVLLGFLFFICILHLHDVLLNHKPQPFIYYQF